MPFICNFCKNPFQSVESIKDHPCAPKNQLRLPIEVDKTGTKPLNPISVKPATQKQILPVIQAPEGVGRLSVIQKEILPAIQPKSESVEMKLTFLFQCIFCQESFSSQSILSEHVMKVHKSLKPQKCTQCDDETWFSENGFKGIIFRDQEIRTFHFPLILTKLSTKLPSPFCLYIPT